MSTFFAIVGLILLIIAPFWVMRDLGSMFKGDGTSSASGIVGAMREIDRITRPSIEHVEHVADEAEAGQEIDGA